MTTTPAPASREAIPEHYRWNLHDIFSDWAAWQAACDEFAAGVDRYAGLRGTLARGPEAAMEAFHVADHLGQLAYKIWYFASLAYDENQRDNDINARRQQVQILFARWRQATSWFDPELLTVGLDALRAWMAASADLAVYRFAIEDLYRQQEHVLDEAGERLLALATRFDDSPDDAYGALSTADARFPLVTMADGTEIRVTYGQYRAILATRRAQVDRAAAYRAFHELYAASLNTYAALYNAVCQRDWCRAQARHHGSTLEAALHGNNIPPSVVENLIATTRQGVEPLRRYHRLRRRVLGLERYGPYDTSIPLVDLDRPYPYDQSTTWVGESVAVLGRDYQQAVERSFRSRWIDVYENDGKRSGAYSAPVYGVHPYMLLNHNDTLDSLFTLAHEMGHSMHTMLAHATQPFVYADYTIFVAEVPSTLNEALLLDFMLARTEDSRERAVLLQHAIDEIAGTFYTQVMFADFELQAHRLVERGEPITAAILGDLYLAIWRDYFGDAVEPDPLSHTTWARISHFFSSPYYVYQYATCFASAARLFREITAGPPDARADAVERYLTLLRSGGSNHPMTLLQKAGVDLREPDTVRAVIDHLEQLVTQLERELGS